MRSALAATNRSTGAVCLVAVLVGLVCGNATASVGVGIAAGLGAFVLMFLLLLWRGMRIALTIDEGRDELEVRNFLRSYRVPASQVVGVDRGAFVLTRLGVVRATRIACVQVHRSGGPTVKVQASLNNGPDSTLRDALQRFCAAHGIQFDYSIPLPHRSPR